MKSLETYRPQHKYTFHAPEDKFMYIEKQDSLFLDVYPGQTKLEETLTERSVQQGFSHSFHPAQNTSFFSQNFSKLNKKQTIVNLVQTAQFVLEKQAKVIIPNESIFSFPGRIVSSDAQRDIWSTELSKSVSLSELQAQIPHG